MFAVFFLGAASSAAAACSAIPGYFSGSIPGVKNFTGELYKATWTGPGAASVFSVGSPSGWSTSSLAFSADNTTVVATFDNHHVGHGTVGASCAVISWDDKSVWQTAPPPQKLNIHLSPHSHDDVGWDATYMEYFLGCHPPGVRYANVSQEISGVVQGLLADARRRFSVVEQAYFQIWFEAQAPALQAQVQTLVAQRRLVFLNGGWSMHDESNPTYIDMLDNTAVGHRNIVNNFGVAGLPKVTWQIDPFGQFGAPAKNQRGTNKTTPKHANTHTLTSQPTPCQNRTLRVSRRALLLPWGLCGNLLGEGGSKLQEHYVQGKGAGARVAAFPFLGCVCRRVAGDLY